MALLEGSAQFRHQALFGWVNIFAAQSSELFEECSLLVVEILGRFDHEPNKKVTASATL